MDLAAAIALSMGAAWASGINLYAALFMLGMMGFTGHMELPSGMEVLADPAVMMAAGFMYCVEFFADKIPGVDNSWDAIHSFVRIPAGAILAATAMGSVSMEAQVAAAIIGGTLTSFTHAGKAGSRLLVNTSPEPVSNITLSVAEDVAVFSGLWIAVNHPLAFIIMLVVFVIALIWMLPKIWRALVSIGRKIRNWLTGSRPTSDPYDYQNDAHTSSNKKTKLLTSEQPPASPNSPALS